MTCTRSLSDRCTRALDLLRGVENDRVVPGLVFAEAALQTVEDAEYVDEVLLAARHADRCLRAVSVPDQPEHRRRFIDAHQLVVGVAHAGGAC